MDIFSGRFAIFVGREDETVVYDFVSEENLYIIFTAEKKDQDTVGAIIEEIKAKLLQVTSLSEIEALIDTNLSDLGDALFSFAATVVCEKIIYIVTRGEGAVFVRRAGNVQRLITGKKSASGKIKEGDLFMLVSSRLEKTIETELPSAIDPQEIVEELKTKSHEGSRGMMGMFISFKKAQQLQTETPIVTSIPQINSPITSSTGSSSLKEKFTTLSQMLVSQSSSRSKKVTFVIMIVLFAVLVWSVVFGYQRRAAGARAQKIAATKIVIESKLAEAADLSSLNLDRSQELLTEVKAEMANLKKAVGQQNKTEITALEAIIQQKEKTLSKTENAKAEVFYDLSLITKNAKAQAIAFSGDTLALLNRETGEVYELSVSNKSADTIQNKELRGATSVGVYEDLVFVQSKSGIFKIYKKTVSKIIEPDEKWKEVSNIALFNGNIYLLDRGADEVYKYLVAENGYSGLQSYFKSGQTDLASANSLAIDSSVYIATDKSVLKYTSGIKDSFSVNLPDKEGASFADIFTSVDTSSVYLLDKTKGRVYVVSKTGEYQKQIESSVFKNALDFVVVEKNDDPKKTGILVLTETKLFRVPLD